jgi:hypothetical protein
MPNGNLSRFNALFLTLALLAAGFSHLASASARGDGDAILVATATHPGH